MYLQVPWCCGCQMRAEASAHCIVPRSHIVVAKGGRLQNVSIGVKPAESVTDALAAVAGGGAVPQAEAAAADEEKKEAAAEEAAAAAGKADEPEVSCLQMAAWAGPGPALQKESGLSCPAR